MVITGMMGLLANHFDLLVRWKRQATDETVISIRQSRRGAKYDATRRTRGDERSFNSEHFGDPLANAIL